MWLIRVKKTTSVRPNPWIGKYVAMNYESFLTESIKPVSLTGANIFETYREAEELLEKYNWFYALVEEFEIVEFVEKKRKTHRRRPKSVV